MTHACDPSIAYATTGACLRATILRYFGDPAVTEPCWSCGNCEPNAIDAHDRELVRKILSGIARSGERYGRRRIAAMLVGDTRDLPPSLTGLSTTGLLRQEGSASVERWIDAAVAADLVAVSADKYRTLSLTDRGRAVMCGRLENWQIVTPMRRPDFSLRRQLRAHARRAHPRRRFSEDW